MKTRRARLSRQHRGTLLRDRRIGTSSNAERTAKEPELWVFDLAGDDGSDDVGEDIADGPMFGKPCQ
jgi:hypothetical protein